MRRMKVGILLIEGLFIASAANAFYDASCETHHQVKNVKTDYAAPADGVTSDKDAIQAAVDYVSKHGGGDVVIPYDADGYLFNGIQLKSDVHLLIDARTELALDVQPGSGGTFFLAGSDGQVKNISIEGVGGRFKANIPSTGGGSKAGTRAVSFNNVFNFRIANIDIHAAKENFSGIVFSPSGWSRTDADGFPTQGTVENASIFNAHFGYGLIQAQAAKNVLFQHLSAEGGVALRMETGWDKMNIEQYGGVSDIVGKDIVCVDGHGAVLLGAHSMQNGLVEIDGVYASNCVFAVKTGAGRVNATVAAANPDALPGTFGDGTYMKNIVSEFGITAQLTKKNYKLLPAPLQSYIQEGADGGDVALAPSMMAVGIDEDIAYDLTIKNITAIGYEYMPAIYTGVSPYSVFSGDSLNKSAASVGSAYSDSLAEDATSPSGEPRTFSKLSGPAWLKVAASGRLSGTPSASDGGVNEFQVQVELENQNADIVWMYVTVEGGGNGAPTFSSDSISKPKASAGVAYSKSIAGSASDSDGDTLRFKNLAGPAWLNVAGNGALSGTPTEADVGQNSWTVKVSDGHNGSDTAVLKITVDSSGSTGINQAPVFSSNVIKKPAASVGKKYKLGSVGGNATDPDGNEITFEKKSGPEWLKIRSNGSLRGTPTSADLGINTWTVNVTDSKGATDSARLKITVN